MKEIIKYLKKALPLAVAQLVAYGIFFEFLFSGKIYTMPLSELVALALFLLVFCVLLFIMCKRDESVRKNSDNLPKQ